MTERPWGESAADFQGEPRNVFCNFLIWNLKQVATYLYGHRDFPHAIGLLLETVDSLDADSQKKLENQRKQLREFWIGNKKAQTMDLEDIFKEVTAYLHETYLREVRFALPKYPSGKIEAPKE